jgi:flagellar biosynthesis/type III secretory pathway M-ring protein FliF/YscJ
MPPWAQVVMGLAVLYFVTIVSALYFYRKEKQESTQKLGRSLGLEKGQTIMAVMEKQKILYFCIGKDGQEYVHEEDVK